MTILEQAAALGNEIAASDVMRAYNAAKTAYETDSELQALVAEYGAQRALMGQEFSREPAEQDESLLAQLRDRVQELTESITKNENYLAFSEAQRAFNELMAQVNSEISYAVFGVRPSSCTHDCSTCGGCH